MIHHEMQELRRALHKAIDDAFERGRERWNESRPRFEEGRRDFHRKMDEGRERAEKFREWMESEAGRAPEKMKKFREEAEKRFEGFGRRLRDRMEESGRKAPEEMKEFRERLEKRMEEFGKRFHGGHDEADAKGAARGEREFHLRLRAPDGETHESHGGPHAEGFGKLRQGAEDFALKFLQTPQGRELARESMRFMQEQSERMGRRMEALQGDNSALKEKMEAVQKKLLELEGKGGN